MAIALATRGALLPPAVDGWPVVACLGPEVRIGRAAARHALARIRAEVLWWPSPRSDAVPATSVIVCGRGHHFRLATGQPLARVAPASLTDLTAVPGHPAGYWAVLAGLSGSDRAAEDLLCRSIWHCPWTGRETTLKAGLDALSFLHAAARQNARPAATIGMSRWKRRAVAPFLTGPHGPPLHFRTDPGPWAGDLRHAYWGEGPEAPGGSSALCIEDGFLRSVGLGLRHVMPASLVISDLGLHYRPGPGNGLDRIVAQARFNAPLIARARALRSRIIDLGLTKYNLPDRGRLPGTGGREAVLVPGQVEGDASLDAGAAGIRTNLELLRFARAAHPDAFLLYKPHPDVLTGLRPGALAASEIADLADGITKTASAGACIAWCDRVVTMTSQLGFEALLRERPVTALGAPFYAGWGLTRDVAPPVRPRRLTLEELIAAALILYPRYIDPASRLPAPVEQVIAALGRERQSCHRLGARLRRLRRYVVSEIMNAAEAPKWRMTR
ncbi:MAG: hypothetical protein AAF503_03505 [Pseudomonadota bacterium]